MLFLTKPPQQEFRRRLQSSILSLKLMRSQVSSILQHTYNSPDSAPDETVANDQLSEESLPTNLSPCKTAPQTSSHHKQYQTGTATI